MGKRSNFERIPRDFYRTPIEAVRPLIPHLPAEFSYAEPCAGDGALVRHLSPRGHCVLKSDIEDRGFRLDFIGCALGIDGLDVAVADYIITNPPWDRKILHPMVEHFSALRPTWLLFDADWMHTKQSARFAPWCQKIVSVGRVKWMPDSKMTGKDNCAWYLFDQTTPRARTEFFGRVEA